MTEYIYMTPEEFSQHREQSLKAIEALDPPAEMSLADLIALEAMTGGRFSFSVDNSGRVASCVFVNFYQTKAGNYKIHPVTKAAVLQEHQKRKIEIKE